MPNTLLRGAGLLTGSGGVAQSDILIEGNSITAIGQSIERLPADLETIDAAGSIALPGFVDTHRHMWQGALKGVACNDIFATYFGRAVIGYAGRVTADDVYVGNMLSALEAIDSGTTTVLDWSHAVNSPAHADSAVQALRDSGLRAVFAYGPPGEDASGWWTQSDRDHPIDVRRVREEILRDDDARVTMAMALRGPEFSTIGVCTRDLQVARDLGLRSTMHIGIPGPYHRFDSVRALQNAGLLGDDITHVHANSYTDEDFRILADHGGSLSFSPEVELQMGFGWPPLRSALNAGLRPSLSVDVVTAIGGDLRQQARFLLQIARALDNQDHLDKGEAPPDLELTVEDALDFATHQGARALGLDKKIGSIDVGKRADILLIDADAWNLFPTNNAAGQIIQASHPGNIHTVMIDGNIVKRNGRVTVISDGDRADLIDRASASAARLA